MSPFPWDYLDFGFFAQSLYEYSQCSNNENAINLGLDAIGLLPGIPALGTLRRIDEAVDVAKSTDDILVLGRQSGLVNLAKKEGGRLSSTASKTPKDIYKQNSSDIRKADKIIFNGKGVPNSLQEAIQNGGQYSRTERELILSRPDLIEKTVFK